MKATHTSLAEWYETADQFSIGVITRFHFYPPNGAPSIYWMMFDPDGNLVADGKVDDPHTAILNAQAIHARVTNTDNQNRSSKDVRQDAHTADGTGTRGGTSEPARDPASGTAATAATGAGTISGYASARFPRIAGESGARRRERIREYAKQLAGTGAPISAVVEDDSTAARNR